MAVDLHPTSFAEGHSANMLCCHVSANVTLPSGNQPISGCEMVILCIFRICAHVGKYCIHGRCAGDLMNAHEIGPCGAIKRRAVCVNSLRAAKGTQGADGQSGIDRDFPPRQIVGAGAQRQRQQRRRYEARCALCRRND